MTRQPNRQQALSYRLESVFRQPPRLHRRGLGQIEILVTAILLGTLTGLLSTISYQIRRVQKDARLYQVATYEISNHLRRLTKLPLESIPAELEQLQLSPIAIERLPNVDLKGTMVEGPRGKRIELEIQWDRLGSPAPLRMTAWLTSIQDSSASPETSPQEPLDGSVPATPKPTTGAAS